MSEPLPRAGSTIVWLLTVFLGLVFGLALVGLLIGGLGGLGIMAFVATLPH